MRTFLWQLVLSIGAFIILRPVAAWVHLPSWGLITIIVLTAANIPYPRAR